MEQVIELVRQDDLSETHVSPMEFGGEERRRKPRIYAPFPATVRGVSDGGENFEVHTELENISGRGLYLRMDQSLEPGTKIFVLIYLSATPSRDSRAPRFGIRGIVRRAEQRPGSDCGIAVAITHSRFL